MNNPNWLPIISFVFTVVILLVSFFGGYAVLRKRVKDLEDDNQDQNESIDKKMSESDHIKICKISTLEMKKHVSDELKNTFDDFKKETFRPAMTQLLKAINGD